jgi:hypothetical protein
MKTKDFQLAIKVKASPEEAIEKINQPGRWWAKKVDGKSAGLKDQFTVDFGETYVTFQISELVPGKKVAWKVTDCNLHWINDKKEWNGSEVVFEVAPDNGSTKIDFIHKGMTPEWECYESCVPGWTDHVSRSLVSFIDKGKGDPV